MQKIKNIEQVIIQLKPLLRRYLEDMGTNFRNSLFQCPNRVYHSNMDHTPSAGFVPNTENQLFHCFTCGESSDIFGAYKFLEEKEINGAYWYVAVKELADRYKIFYELEALSPEEEEFNNVQTFLQTLVKNAHNYLIKNHPKQAMDYIKKRLWVGAIDHFQLGYLPLSSSNSIKKFVAKSFEQYPELSKHLSINITEPDNFTEKIMGRLIYPAKHRYGYVLGLISRKLEEEDERPKYIKHFLKSTNKDVLFNLSKAYKSVYVVEGASSVFTLYNNDVKNAVATLGTAFTENMYSNLIKHGVDKIVLCFDGDKAGQEGIKKAIELTESKSDIKVLVKILPEGKDPDNIVMEEGIEAFKKIPEISSFKYQLNNFNASKDNEQKQLVYRKSLFEIIIGNKDAIIREKMLKIFTQETGILKTTLIEEIEKYEKTKGLISDVGIGEVLKEEESLLNFIGAFEERALRSDRLKGMSTGFPMLDEKLDGLQTGLILVAGKWNTGKSAFMQTMALNILNDPTKYVLYFSIDDPVIYSSIPRFLANISQVPINVISNPIYKIDKNETLDDIMRADLRNRRNEAIVTLKSYAKRLGLKDATEGYDVSFIEKMIKIYKVAAGGRKLVVFVDFLNMVSLAKKNIDRTETETLLAGFFKHMAGMYDVPVVCTVESTKGVADTTISESNIKGSSTLQFRSDLTLLLSSDFEATSKSEMFFYDDQGEAQPIVKVQISKNKMSGFRKSIYYRFFPKFSKFQECDNVEQLEFSRKG